MNQNRMANHMNFGHIGHTKHAGRGGGQHGHHAKHHGFCHSCCHPVAKCCCHRECRKESKELIVNALDISDKEQELTTTLTQDASKLFRVFSSETDSKETGEYTEENSKEEEAAKITAALPINTNAREHSRLPNLRKHKIGKAVIGGGCCVHISIEYMPLPELIDRGLSSASSMATVSVDVLDSESTRLGWEKLVKPGYHIKQGIITTQPGALLTLKVVNAIARVRWCEIFSC